MDSIEQTLAEGNCGGVTDRGEEACECAVKRDTTSRDFGSLGNQSSSAAFSAKLQGDEQKSHPRPERSGECAMQHEAVDFQPFR
ncbi:MAG: hypothetical protein ACI92S_004100 [Planctomycetaceae bacterium]